MESHRIAKTISLSQPPQPQPQTKLETGIDMANRKCRADALKLTQSPTSRRFSSQRGEAATESHTLRMASPCPLSSVIDLLKVGNPTAVATQQEA